MKTCYVCKETKPLGEFGSNSSRKDGKQSYCKACCKGEQTKWYYQRKFGITLEERDEMLRKQNGKCAICDEDITFQDNMRKNTKRGTAQIDHCHGKGHIRGILCGPCNNGLGCFRDDLFSISKAFEYIQNDLNTGKD